MANALLCHFQSLCAVIENGTIQQLYLIDISELVLNDSSTLALLVAVSNNDMISDSKAVHKTLPCCSLVEASEWRTVSSYRTGKRLT